METEFMDDHSLFSLMDLARRVKPRRSYSTLYRWSTAGHEVSGTIIKLRSKLIAGVIHSSLADFHEFIRNCNQVPDEEGE